MDPALQSLIDVAVNFFWTYLISGLITLLIALLAVAFGMSLAHRRDEYRLRAAVRAEMVTDRKISASLVEYSEKQLTSDPTVTPMPRFHDSAYKQYKRSGLLAKLPRSSVEDLENIYLYMESVNEAGRRQEDLAFGPSAAYPNSHQLRLENLTYIHDTTYNVIKPYHERLQDIRL